MSQELAIQDNQWSTMQQQAAMLVKSGFLPPAINTVEKALALALTGRELGIGMMEAIRGIYIIEAKPSISPQLMLALANRTKELENLKIEETDQGVVVTVKRKEREAYTTYFGKVQADAQGLSGKPNYKKQPMLMYKWRALAEALRFTSPDAISGLYTPDELGAEVAVDDQGSMQVKAEPIANKYEIKKKENPNENNAGILQKINQKPAAEPKDLLSAHIIAYEKEQQIIEEIPFGEPKEVEQVQKALGGKITLPQQKRIHAIRNACGLSEEYVQKYMEKTFQKKSTKDLDWKEMNKLVDWMQSFDAQLVSE